MLRPTAIFALTVLLVAAIARPADPTTAPSRESGNVALSSLAHSSISIPWEDLRGLVENANIEHPPVDFALSTATYDANVGDKNISVIASVDVVLLVDNWVLAPIGTANSGITSATVDGQPGILVARGDVLAVLIKGKGLKKVRIAISRDIIAEAGQNRFEIHLLPSALASVTATIPQIGLSIRAPDASGVTVAENAQATTLKGTFRGGTTATVFRQKVQPSEILATTLTRVDVEPGTLRCHADINYEILHAGVDTLRVALPAGIEIISVAGPGVRDSQNVVEGKQRTLVVSMKEPVQGNYSLSIEYLARFDDAKGSAASVPLVSNPGARQDRGFIGIEVRDSVEVVPQPTGTQRIDVKELPEAIWKDARSPLLFAYRYDAAGEKLTLALTRNADLDVLVAMSDICEASTTFAPDGKSITKMMFVTRNNLKQYMTLKMPEGAQVWSAFVDDHPVTPARSARGDVLVPLRKSEPEDADDDDSDGGKSYRARRDRRRSQEPGAEHAKQMDRRMKEKRMEMADDAPPDLKPYDVEIVFVTPPMKFADRGQVKPALPQSDVPIGQLSWAIFLPENLRVVDAEGNVAEVSRFTLPFKHFGDVAYGRGKGPQAMQDKLQKAAQDIQQAASAQDTLMADRAKAQGVLPVRIEIPMIGEIHRFEKFLVVDETPTVTLTYHGH